MKSVTYEEFLAFEPCWADDEKGRRRLQRYARKLGGKATALDILRLDRIPADDRFWAVLRPEFIDEPIMHEFACRCAENALSLIENPDPRSIAAIEAKRAWLRGKITDKQLAAARDAAWAAARDAARAAARDAAWDAAWAAARAAARDAAWAAARDAAWAAARAAARDAAWDAAWDAAQKRQIKELIKMLEEAENAKT